MTPVAAGVATITVMASGADNSIATQRFRVTVLAATAFTDHIRPGLTLVRALHFLELRTRVAALRARAGLPPVRWTDPVLTVGVTPAKRVHLTELRTGLDAAGARGREGGAVSEREPGGGEADRPGVDAAGRPGHDQASGGCGGAAPVDLLPDVPGDGDHGIPVEREEPSSTPSRSRGARRPRLRSSDGIQRSPTGSRLRSRGGRGPRKIWGRASGRLRDMVLARRETDSASADGYRVRVHPGGRYEAYSG